MVFNLWESRQLRNTNLVKSNAPDKPEYLKEYSKHIADDSFYQIPALGIQIACDDVGFLGPLALLVFSFNSLMAFTACDGQVKCAGRFANVRLINTLLKTEMLPGLPKALYRSLLFLPVIACIGVAVYRINTYFYGSPIGDPLYEVLMANRIITPILDVGGLVLTVFVVMCYVRISRSLEDINTETKKCPEIPAGSEECKTATAGS